MEGTPATFRLFSSVAFDRSMSIWSLAALCRPHKVFYERHWLHIALLYMGAYLLVFPTMMSVMTSYQAKLVPYAPDPKNKHSLIDVTSLEIPLFVILDGERIGLTNNFRSDSIDWNDSQSSDNLTFAEILIDCTWHSTEHQRIALTRTLEMALSCRN